MIMINFKFQEMGTDLVPYMDLLQHFL